MAKRKRRDVFVSAAVWLSVFRFRDAFCDVSTNGGYDGEFEVPPTKQRRNERTAKAD